MNKKIFKLIILCLCLLGCLLTTSCGGCNKDGENDVEDVKPEINTYSVTFYENGNVVHTETVEENKCVESYDIKKNHYTFLGWYDENDDLFDFSKKINENINLYGKWELVPFVSFEITGKQEIEHNTSVKLNISYEELSTKKNVEWSISDESILSFLSTGKNYCKVSAVLPGTATVYASCENLDGTTYVAEYTITVLGTTYNIEYNLDEEDMQLLPTDAIKTYNTGEFPIQLPILDKDFYQFSGWMIDGKEGVFKEITKDDLVDGNLLLTPKWIFPRLDLYYETGDVVVGVGENNTVCITPLDITDELLAEGYNFKTGDNTIATIDENGVITGVADGYTEISVSLKNNPSVNATIGVTVSSKKNTMNELLLYFTEIAQSSNIVKNIDVVGWQFTYEHELRTSVIGYLFEDLVITENIAPLSNYNRPGSKYPKYYITVHDTGDVEYTAKDWSETVYNQFNKMTQQEYTASYQYVLDNKDVYHNIPDDETAYHAGDGSRMYELLETGVYGTNLKPNITITSDGYYAIDNQKTKVLAPTNKGTILTTADINDCGIRCVIQNGQYYLGNTWFDSTYRKIGNYGGNRNSIGIETCMTQGDDIYYSWQRLAKLVAKLMDENDLTVNDVVPHHYFSGKNCPQTMREAGMWDHFLNLVQIEYDVLQYIQEGYEVSFTSNNTDYVNNLGRVIKSSSLSKTVSYTITVSKDGISESITLTTTIQHKPFN